MQLIKYVLNLHAGAREVIFLRHLQGKCGNGKNACQYIFIVLYMVVRLVIYIYIISYFFSYSLYPVVNLYEAYLFQHNVCVVMPLYRCTLMDLLQFPEDGGEGTDHTDGQTAEERMLGSDVVKPM